MQFTPAEKAAIMAHSASLAISHDECVRQAATERAQLWQREQDAYARLAAQRGVSVQDLLRRGCFTDDDLS
ncbi:hypothetical protein [Streptomyces sp900116325]|uniref:hypothetical protein n=1 Tax=Streptomyces sp. 900116325 TaxID=3154295 RepID=UPI00332C29F8